MGTCQESELGIRIFLEILFVTYKEPRTHITWVTSMTVFQLNLSWLRLFPWNERHTTTLDPSVPSGLASPFSAVASWRLCKLWSSLSIGKARSICFPSLHSRTGQILPSFLTFRGTKGVSSWIQAILQLLNSLVESFYLFCHWVCTEHQEIITMNWETLCVCTHSKQITQLSAVVCRVS